jgi:hypothetical protein
MLETPKWRRLGPSRASALRWRGLAGKVKLMAFDASDDLVQDLKDGSIDARWYRHHRESERGKCRRASETPAANLGRSRLFRRLEPAESRLNCRPQARAPPF